LGTFEKPTGSAFAVLTPAMVARFLKWASRLDPAMTAAASF
jgi:hypothetical protein